MNYLKLTLKGILQSYGGAESGWVEDRDTGPVPTTSAVAGLIACALGIRKDDPAYGDLCKLSYYSTHPGVSRLDDYQIVSPKEPGKRTKVSSSLTCSGTRMPKGRPIYKHYLEDAEFSVLVGSEDVSLLRSIHDALWNPKWLYYLGRACCTPSASIVAKEFSLENEDILKEGDYICI